MDVTCATMRLRVPRPDDVEMQGTGLDASVPARSRCMWLSAVARQYDPALLGELDAEPSLPDRSKENFVKHGSGLRNPHCGKDEVKILARSKSNDFHSIGICIPSKAGSTPSGSSALRVA